MVGRDDQRLDRFFGVGVNQSRTARQLRQLAHECARPMRNDRGAAARLIVLSYFDISTQDDGESETHFADFCQRRACTIGADLTKAAHALDFGRLQNREHLVASSINDRLGRSSHGLSASLAGGS